MRRIHGGRGSTQDGRRTTRHGQRATGLQHHRAARATAAANRASAVRQVVVRELFTRANISSGPNPDCIADYLGVAVGGAGMIDVPRDIPTDCGVTSEQMIQLEAPDMSLREVPALAPQTFPVRDLFAGVVDDSRVFRDGLSGKYSPALNP